jgi:hypothetical protein
VFCQLLQDVEFSQPLHAMENESEKNNNQIVLFKTVTHNISDYFRLKTHTATFRLLNRK